FLLSRGNYSNVDDPLGINGTVAQKINDQGQIVGYYMDGSNHQHGFLLSSGIYTTIDDPFGTKGTTATGINNAGQIVGYYTDSATVAQRSLDRGAFPTPVDDPGGISTIPRGNNAAGQIVGAFGTARGGNASVKTKVANPAAPPGPTADMVLRAANNSLIAGQY